MRVHHRLYIIILMVALTSGFAALKLQTSPIANVAAGELPRHVEDASLRSVYFFDHKEGWAVGDEGVILHTLNGGKTWHRQLAGVRSSLRSVQFLTPDIGWVVGREELPHGMGSVGVVLYTSDGGMEWKRQLPNTLPGLNQVRFVDAKTGFLFGDGSDAFPFGMFKTTDAGRSWEPVPGPRTTSWLTGDFYSASSGVVAGGWSRFGTLRPGKAPQEPAGLITQIWHPDRLLPKDKGSLGEHAGWLAGRDVACLQILGKKTLAVGQGGLVLSSVSGGSAWGVPEKILPADVLANLDFHALCSVKDKLWIVGRPGSVVVHSADAGKTWSLCKTGQRLPLHGVFFFDEKVGWAVGDAGTILHSADGGKSWAIQQQAGKRAAGLTVHALNQTTPIDTLAYLGAADGYLMASLRLTAPDAQAVAWGRSGDERRYGEAVRKAGGLTGETLWHFPMPQHLEGCDKKTILAHWNHLHAGRAEEELIRQLVLSLRMWRPSVVITEHPDNKTPLSAMVGEAVQEAIRRAADSKAFPEQLSELGLETWTVSATFGLGDGTGAAVNQNNHEVSERLQATVREFAGPAHALLVDGPTSLPRLRKHVQLNGSARIDWLPHWFVGLDQKEGEARRVFKEKAPADAARMQALQDRRGAIDMADNLEDPTRALKLLPAVLEKLNDEDAAVAAFAIAGRYAERGQWYLAQEMYLYLVDRSPTHPYAAEACRWLMRLNASGEARRRHQLKQFAVAEPIQLSRKKADPLTEEKLVKTGHVVRAADGGILSRSDVRDWNKGTIELSKRLTPFGTAYAIDPLTVFCLNAAKRKLGDAATAAHDALGQFSRLVPTGPWHEAAMAERWLTDRSLPTPRRLARARNTEVRPFLDGKFDDPCWKDMKPLVLTNAVGESAREYATESMFCYDQEFLYVALRCKHPAGARVAPVKPRARDADLDGFDRVGILLDLDRDLATAYHLEVDQRGCVRDSCWGDRSWNPKWFVAVHSVDDCWQIEAAIPLGELTAEKITQETAWAFNVVRVLPGRGVQSWSQPADVQPRMEGLSLLMFQSGGPRPAPMPPP